MSTEPYPIADWSCLREEPDFLVPLPGGLTMPFRRIPKGSFWMGARSGAHDEEPRHRVVLAQDSYMGKFVVTQAEWRTVAQLNKKLAEKPGLDPSNEKNRGDRRPVTDISWDDAQAWLVLLGKVPMFPRGFVPRLPTEAEWEYACCAGSESDYTNGDGAAALGEAGWFGEAWERGAHGVDERLELHSAGLAGMHGSVCEWCQDVYDEDTYRKRVDGVCNPIRDLANSEEHSSRQRVGRGGSWYDTPRRCRSAFRFSWLPSFRVRSLGFRVCLAFPSVGVGKQIC